MYLNRKKPSRFKADKDYNTLIEWKICPEDPILFNVVVRVRRREKFKGSGIQQLVYNLNNDPLITLLDFWLMELFFYQVGAQSGKKNKTIRIPLLQFCWFLCVSFCTTFTAAHLHSSGMLLCRTALFFKPLSSGHKERCSLQIQTLLILAKSLCFFWYNS